MKRKLTSSDISTKVNTLRINIKGNPMKMSLLKEIFRSFGLPVHNTWFSELVKLGVFTREKNLYFFADFENPIHYSILESAYNKYLEQARIYMHKSAEKKKILKAQQEKILQLSEQLKQFGYTITDPDGNVI